MIGFAETIGTAPRWFGGNITKPGYGEPKPPKPVQTYDPPEAMEKCLNCTAEECNTKSKERLLRRKRGGKKASKIAERDEKVLKLLKSGWVNIDAICEELGISRDIYFSTKKTAEGKGANMNTEVLFSSKSEMWETPKGG